MPGKSCQGERKTRIEMEGNHLLLIKVILALSRNSSQRIVRTEKSVCQKKTNLLFLEELQHSQTTTWLMH